MGIAGKTFGELFMERKTAYEKYADIVVTRNINRANDAQKVIEEIISGWGIYCEAISY